MAKLTLNDVTAGNASTTLINANNALIEAALENTQSLDDTSPNARTANLDMNGFNILNQGNPITIVGWSWEGAWVTSTAYTVGDVVENGGSAYICIEAHTSGTFATDLAALKWELVASASLPDQTGNSGKFLTTDGVTASWGNIATTYLPLAGGTLTGALVSVGITDTGNIDFSGAVLQGGTPLVFEGVTDNGFETSLVITDPTADRTLTMPDADVDLTKVRTATTTLDGVVELATTAEVQTGTDTTRSPTIQSLRQGLIINGTMQASTSGTEIDFTSIPSWVKIIRILFDEWSVSGTSNTLIQIGDSGGIEDTNYAAQGSIISSSVASNAYTTGFGIGSGSAANELSGIITLTLMDSSTNLWVASGNIGTSAAVSATYTANGKKTLSDTLDRVRITTVNGTDTLDNGNINIQYE